MGNKDSIGCASTNLCYEMGRRGLRILPNKSIVRVFQQNRDIYDIGGDRMTAPDTTFVWTGIANIATVQPLGRPP